MLPQIFDIQEGVLIINEHILSIPELKAVYEAYEDPKPALLFLRHLCDPFGPYNQIEESIKEEVIFSDFPGEYSPEDEVMLNARKKLESFYMTPGYRYYLDNKVLMETLGKFARTAQVETGRDGNYAQLQAQMNNVGKSYSQFRLLEKMAEEDLQKSRVRGGAFQSYDQENED